MNQNARNWEHCLQQASLTDVGLRRANNQDSMAVVLAAGPDRWLERGHLFMVADGMGAHAAGELASKLATDTVSHTYYKLRNLPPPDALREAIEDANRQINTRGEASDDFRGMGTTASVLALLPQGALVGHVGDSRAYRLRQGRIEQLTFDHSLVWEIRAAEKLSEHQVPDYIPKNVITRSLGPNPKVRVDLEGPFPVEVGDVFLLCSDGLSGQVADDEIGKILGSMDADEAVHALVDLAKLRGGPDNITVVVARVTGPELTLPGAETLSQSVGDSSSQPALWLLLAVLAVAALGLGAASLAMGEFWLGLAAVICTAGAIASGVAASARANGREAADYAFATRPLGKGPYTTCNGAADAAFVEKLAVIVGQLKQLAEQESWDIDWARFHTLADQGAAASQSGDFAAAVRVYCTAVSFLMAQLKTQRERA